MSFSLDKAPSQKGKIAVVTGANTGLGFETTLALAGKECKVVMACRNKDKAEKAMADIRNEVPNADLEFIRLDLNSLKSVREFAKAYSEKHDKLDLLINNAGLMIPPLMRTEEGFESQFGVNHLGHFLLTNLLFPILKKTENARIVSLSSIAHKNGRIQFDDPNWEKSYSKSEAYNQSKVACLMFAYELQRRLNAAGSSVISVAAHPGVSDTELGRYIPKALYLLATPLMPLVTHKPKYAALPTLMAALDENVIGGDFYGPTGFNEMKGEPGKAFSTAYSKKRDEAEKLWKMSEELTGEKFNV
ncbi:MAG: NAD(P)-dependent dehydrogenase (short-subunit alcohol dehydrogenase family) [Bacteroidia bacterium]|jgi:NAD(P)-dependent dehydrogenase (short-subunit alcohol dehydrogenase family)